MLGDQFLQTSPLGEPQERRKTRARHEIGIIEHRGDAMADSHPADALLCVEFVTVASHILFAEVVPGVVELEVVVPRLSPASR